MYYQLDCDGPGMTAYINPEGRPIRAPMHGQLVNVAPEKLPIRFKYSDPTGSSLFDYYAGKCLMSKRLVTALEGAGVDNLQSFEAELRNEADGVVNKDYCVINIVGLVTCADVAASKTSELGSTYYFHDLVIDPSRVGDLRIFRLAESLMDVLIHEQVAKSIESKDFRGVILRPVKTTPSSQT